MTRFLVLAMLIAVPASAEKLSGNVLVWADAPLYLDAKAGAASVVIGGFEKPGRRASYVIPMHVVGESGDFVEVEPTKDFDCTWAKVVKPEGLATLHLFVQKSDLSRVVAKPWSTSFKNGSKISLQAGVSVHEGKVAVDDQQLEVDVPEANLGLAYASHAVSEPAKPTSHTAMLDEASQVTLGDKTFALGPWVSASAENRGANVLFPIASRCVSAVVSVAKDRVQRNVSVGGSATGDAGMEHGRGTSNADRYYLPSGQAMTSETGDHVVATLAGEFDVTKPTGATACGDFVVTLASSRITTPILEAGRPKRTMHLCAPATKVKVEQRSRY
ncbi:MAG: hypothetical protein QM831_25170 [Kofleriaceae bacterium]